MGMSIFGVYTWSKSHPHGHYLSYLSRVVEKGAPYALLLLDTVLDTLKEWGYLGGIKQIQLICDCGGHFRNRAMMHRLAYRWPQKYGIDTAIVFGLEQHLKWKLDGEFGLERRLMDPAAKAGTWLWNIGV